MSAIDVTTSPGVWLRQRRMAAGLTQEDLAERSGVSVRTIADLERGRTSRPYPSSVLALTNALGLPEVVGTELIARYRAKRHATWDAGGRGGDGPRQLPAAVSYFAGRTRELELLDSLLADAGVTSGGLIIAAISGMAGVGKTALALHWAHRIARRFPDGQLYANLHGFDPLDPRADPASVLRRFLDALQVHPERVSGDVEALAGLYRSVLSDRKMLILLDNAGDVAQVRPLLPASPGCVVVVTSRHELSALAVREDARLLRLDVLTEAEATDLLTVRLGMRRAEAEPTAVQDLGRLCARLPLALSVTVARAAAQPDLTLGALADELTELQGRLDALDAGDPTANVRTVFSLSYRHLPGPAARMFRLLSLHPGPDISALAAASLAGVPPRQGRAELRDLVRASLINETVPGRYAFHELLRAYAVEQAQANESDHGRQAAVHRMLDHCLYTADAAHHVLYPGREVVALPDPATRAAPEDFAGTAEALAWLEAENQVNLKLIDLALREGLNDHAWRLPVVLWTFYYVCGHWHDCVATQQVALEAARRCGAREGQALALCGLGFIQGFVGDLDQAHRCLAQAREIFRELGDNLGLARACVSIGLAFANQGRFREALNATDEALRLSENASGDRNMLLAYASALNTGAEFHIHLGEYAQARTRSRQALELCHKIGYAPGEAGTWDTLGIICQHLGEHAEAITCFGNAADLAREAGNRFTVATALAHLGDSHRATGNIAAARIVWAEALLILEDLHHLRAAFEVRAKLQDLGGTLPVSSPETSHGPAHIAP